LHAGKLERKRDDMVRSTVLQLHTAIEDILNTGIICNVLNVKPEDRMGKMRSKRANERGRYARCSLGGSPGFDTKLNFAVALRLMNSTTQEQLMELNTLRNKCSHNWLLKTPVRRGKRPRQKKPPLLLYRGRDLHNVAVLEDFVDQDWVMYLRMFLKFL
jgi:hypothetical protein